MHTVKKNNSADGRAQKIHFTSASGYRANETLDTGQVPILRYFKTRHACWGSENSVKFTGVEKVGQGHHACLKSIPRTISVQRLDTQSYHCCRKMQNFSQRFMLVENEK